MFWRCPLPPALELADEILNILGDVKNVLQNGYVSDRVLNEKNIADIKEEYNSDDIKNELDERPVPPSLEFFYGGENEHFWLSCDMLNLNKNNSAFINFIWSEKGEEILNSNSLSIHTETGDTFYDNFNINENFYDFLLAQQDETKKIIKKKISYTYSFEKCIKIFL